MIAEFNTETATKIVPERNLLVAMLERAVFDFYGDQKIEKQEAAEWLFGPGDLDLPFTFQWVCAQLEIDSELFLERVRHLKPRSSMSTQQWWGSLATQN